LQKDHRFLKLYSWPLDYFKHRNAPDNNCAKR